ncbi:MAG: MarR family transcriptional regulator [Bacteroidia bacterium]|nr:MarR family transcriptional regulator [Bacteroidia bacterium]
MKKLTVLISELTRKIWEMEDFLRRSPEFYDLSITQMYYLEAICLNNEPTLTYLANILQLTKSTVTIQVEKLVEKGYIKKVRSEKDRRSSALQLSKKGNNINKMHHKIHEQLAGALQKSLTDTELKIFIEILNKFLQKELVRKFK